MAGKDSSLCVHCPLSTSLLLVTEVGFITRLLRTVQQTLASKQLGHVDLEPFEQTPRVTEMGHVEGLL